MEQTAFADHFLRQGILHRARVRWGIVFVVWGSEIGSFKGKTKDLETEEARKYEKVGKMPTLLERVVIERVGS